jgi:hypothetical protein
MFAGSVVDPGGYRPGNRVRVILGNARGMRGKVIRLIQARALWHKSDLSPASFPHLPGQICVAVHLTGACVPIALDLAQVRLDPLA